MMFPRLVIASLVMVVSAGIAVADESGNFVVRLGTDTTAVEHYTRTAARVEVDQVGRAPRVLRRQFTCDFVNGAISHLKMVVTPPGSTTPTQTIEATFDPDSMRIQVQNGGGPVQNSSVAMPPGTLVVASSTPWTGYEGQIMKLVQSKSDSLRGTMFFLGFPAPGWFSLHKLGRDSVSVFTEHQDQFHARVDKAGHILGVMPIAGTAKFTVDRVASLDVNAMATSFMAREQAGSGIGVLSPRDTVRVASAGGATLWVDYGRPGKRGRLIFGGVVPYGEVWRTGANAATQFRTDKALDFDGTVVPAGFYTLWTIPSATGWKLVVNGETGQWGTDHKTAKDLYTIDMKVATLPQPVERFTIGIVPVEQGGTLNLDWDTTRAWAAFTVKP
jgi:DUF2911 family protein